MVSEYKAFYKDNKQITLVFLNDSTVLNSVDLAYSYAKILGLLPHYFRDKINVIQFFNIVPNTFDIELSDNYSLILKFKYAEKSNFNKSNNNLDINTYKEILNILITNFYNENELYIKDEYDTILSSSSFRISRISSTSLYQDFLESYAFYFYHMNSSKNIDNDTLLKMESRFTFFERIGLTINSKNLETIQIVENSNPFLAGSSSFLPPYFNENDSSNYSGYDYIGIELRNNEFEVRDAFYFQPMDRLSHVFIAKFEPEAEIEFQIVTDFSYEEALELVEIYSNILGKIPLLLRSDLKYVAFFKDNVTTAPLSTPQKITFRYNMNSRYYKNSYSAHDLIHVLAHASLEYKDKEMDWRQLYARNQDIDVAKRINMRDWYEISLQDNFYPTYYAFDYPYTEDFAESILIYMYYRFKPHLISEGFAKLIENNMQKRIQFFDNLNFNMKMKNLND
jgi:hypothetical protein